LRGFPFDYNKTTLHQTTSHLKNSKARRLIFVEERKKSIALRVALFVESGEWSQLGILCDSQTSVEKKKTRQDSQDAADYELDGR